MEDKVKKFELDAAWEEIQSELPQRVSVTDFYSICAALMKAKYTIMSVEEYKAEFRHQLRKLAADYGQEISDFDLLEVPMESIMAVGRA